MDALDQSAVDPAMLDLDGTPNKSKFVQCDSRGLPGSTRAQLMK
jgi:hypothetical protein